MFVARELTLPGFLNAGLRTTQGLRMGLRESGHRMWGFEPSTLTPDLGLRFRVQRSRLKTTHRRLARRGVGLRA